ncbi:hypothetical protein ACFWA6_13830 [Streptomyces sp. NPDC060020]|uniref:hypothetical protein n=1 Tax=Streptomyces sp. NPDC060020 TaxID=3347038 RepID=UPI0036894DD2
MPLPTTRVVTGHYVNPATGIACTGRVVLAPYPGVWTDETNDQVLTGQGTFTLVNGAVSQALVTTDAAGVEPATGRLWILEERIDGRPYRRRAFELTAGVGPIDITDLVIADPADVGYTRGPEGPAGPAGPAGPQPPLGAAGAGANVALRSTDPTTTNARTPTAHAASHGSGGTDPVSAAAIGADPAGAAASAVAALSALTQTVVKTADETRTSVTAVSDDGHLFASLEANSVYRFTASLLFDGPEAADATLTFTAPAGATGGWAPVAGTLGTTVPDGSAQVKVAARQFGSNSDIGVMASSATLAGIMAMPRGIVTTGATPGLLRLRWAQQTSNASPVSLKAGSLLEVVKVSGTAPAASGINLDNPARMPSDQGLLAWTGDPNDAGHVTAQSSAGVAGRITLVQVLLRKQITWSKIWFGLAGVDGSASLTNCYLGVYDSTGTLRAVTADISAQLMTGAVGKSVDLVTPFTAGPGEYYIALLLGGTWTTNLLTFKSTGAGITVNCGLAAPRLRYSNMLSGQTSLPASLDLTQQSTSLINTGWASQWYGVS